MQKRICEQIIRQNTDSREKNLMKTSLKPKKNPFTSDPSKKSKLEMQKRMADKSKMPKGAEGSANRIMTNIEAPLTSPRPKKKPKTTSKTK